MGFSKKNTEPETYLMQTGYRSATSNHRRRRQSASPGPFMSREQNEQSPLFLLRQLWMRFRRSLIAFRYQAHRITFGAFRRKAVLKFGFLVIAGYFLLLRNNEPAVFPEHEIAQTEQGFGSSFEWEEGGEAKKAKPVKLKNKNEAAPVSKNELSSQQALDYVERFGKIARGEMEKFGIPASISLAQGLIESRAGLSKLAVNNNNHFGIKCFSRRCGKGHCTNFTDDTHKDFFRKFKSPWESWRAHSQLLASGRYAKLKKHGRDYKKWAYGLKSAGYATDRTYAEKLIGIIERYELYKYDR